MVKDLVKLEVSLSMGDHDNPHKASSIIVFNFAVNPITQLSLYIDIVRLDSFSELWTWDFVIVYTCELIIQEIISFFIYYLNNVSRTFIIAWSYINYSVISLFSVPLLAFLVLMLLFLTRALMLLLFYKSSHATKIWFMKVSLCFIFFSQYTSYVKCIICMHQTSHMNAHLDLWIMNE